MSTRRNLDRLKRLEEKLGAECPACGPSGSGIEVVWEDDPGESEDISACPVCGRTPTVIVVRWDEKEGEGS
ncbi:hypothetical protein RxyAA322_06140 [Rubrobacter xylanophilus]|uniref:Uncharacterized protein n=1 Tax=Rubrobacter xylanophilus TaxID=49319 RepID=A0A510HFN1_9ACTN|nr:hypothetical protein [Rubrobacter xylanophilus]BBL78760.1 hypothetical protein RxyAA322_06140 [Rubrobacter xylanophilus]